MAQQQTRTIVVKILSSDEGQQTPSPQPSDNQKGNEPQPEGKPSASAMNTYRFAYKVTSDAISLIQSTAEYSFQRYFAESEDYKTQLGVQNAKTAISQVAGFVGAVAIGAKFGPVGAIIAGTLSVASSVSKAVTEVENQMNAIHQQDYSNYFYGVRAGYVDGNGGTMN